MSINWQFRSQYSKKSKSGLVISMAKVSRNPDIWIATLHYPDGKIKSFTSPQLAKQKAEEYETKKSSGNS